MSGNRNAGTVGIRLAVKDKAVVEKALKDMGRDGERALRKIKKAGEPASKGLLAVSSASSELRGNIDGLNSRLGSVGSVMGSIGPIGIAAGAALAGVTLGIGAMNAAAKDAIASFAELNSQAAIAGLDVEAYQEFEYMAIKLGVSQDALTDGFKEMQLRAEEFASRGAGSAAEAYQELGFTQDEVAKKLKNAPKLFEDIISRVEKLDKASQLLRLDELLGGEAGEQFVKFANAGAAAMADMAREGRELGVIIDRSVIKSAAEASSKLKTLQLVIDRNVDQALIDLAPIALAAAEAFAVVAREVRGLIDAQRELANQSSGNLVSQWDANLEKINSLDGQIAREREKASGMNIEISKQMILNEVSQLEAQQQELTKRNAEISRIMRDRQKPQTGGGGGSPPALSTDLDKRKEHLESLNRAHLVATKQRVALIEWERDQKLAALDEMGFKGEERAKAEALIRDAAAAAIATANEKTAKSRGKLTDEDRKGKRVIEELTTATEAYAERLRILRVLLDRGDITPEKYKQGVAEAGETLKRAQADQLEQSRTAADGMRAGLESYAKDATNAAAQMEGAMTNVFSGLEDTLVEFVKTGKLEFGDLANSIIADFARIAVQQTITGPLASGFAGLFGGGGIAAAIGPTLFSTRHSGGMVGAQGGETMRAVNPAIFHNAPRYHSGGSLRPGERAIIALDNERILTKAQQDNTAGTIKSLAGMVSKPSGPSALDVKVGVSIDDDGSLQAYVKSVSEQTSQATTGQAMQQMQRDLPGQIDNRMAHRQSRGY